MPVARAPDPTQVRRQLDRLLNSPSFAGSERLSRFLRFVVEASLEGKTDRIQEYTIALEVFDRKESFDPRIDSIVRVEAIRLRRSLEDYYLGPGRSDPVRIALPKPGYVPRFERAAMLGPMSRRSVGWAAVATAVAVGIAWAVFPRSMDNDKKLSIGVLPFENLSASDEQAYFAEGVSEALTTDLGRIGSLRVVSRTTMRQYSADYAAPELAEILELDYLVEGAVVVTDQRVRVSAQLIDAHRDEHLWADRYERPVGELLNLQNAIAIDIVNEIRVGLSERESRFLGAERSVDPRAYEAYLKGRFALEPLDRGSDPAGHRPSRTSGRTRSDVCAGVRVACIVLPPSEQAGGL